MTRMVRTAFGTACFLIAGCGGRPEPAQAPAEPAQEAPTCETEATQLGAWLGQLVARPYEVPRPSGTALDESLRKTEVLPDDEASPALLALYRDLTGACPGSEAVLEAMAAAPAGGRLQALVQSVPDMVAGCDCQVDLPALRALLWEMNSRVNTALLPTPGQCGVVAAEMGSWLADLYLGDPSSETRPRRSNLRAELMAASVAPPEKALPALEQLGDRVSRNCPPLREALAAMDEMPARQVLEPLVEQVPVALSLCDCQVDPRAIQDLAYTWHRRIPARNRRLEKAPAE